jgi:Ni/Co efflux regulator RcnB
MRSDIVKGLGVAAAAMALATSAQAQGRGHGRDKDRDRQQAGREHQDRDDRDRRDRDDDRDDRRRGTIRRQDGDVWAYRRDHVPPGLAKKPGQMPPGQYKKRYYTPLQGAGTLGDILRRRGYSVQRMAPYGDSRLVYYRGSDGVVRRAVVSPGANQLGFSNVPSSLLQEVLSALYGR